MKKTTKLWVFTGILLIFNIIIYLTHWGGDTILLLVSDCLPIICACISVVCLYLTFKSFKNYDFAKTVWLLLLIGIALDFVAEILYSTQEVILKVDMNTLFPSIADYVWCLAYIFVFAGLVMMLVGYKKSGLPMGNTKLFFTISIALLVLASVVIYFILVPIIKDIETSTQSKVFYLYYPIADTFVIVPAILLMYITSLFGKGTISKPWQFLAIGFVCFTISDLLYDYLSWQDLYGSGNLIDMGWNFGYLSIGLAGLYQLELIESLNEVKE
jgi:hypothetical protein